MKKIKFKKLISSIACLVMMSSILYGCGEKKQASESTKKTTMVANLGSEPKTIDPTLNNMLNGSIVIFNTFEGLLRVGADNKPEPGLAKSWDIQDNGLKYIFHLRDGLKWTDNSPITAKDFKYSILRTLDPATGSPYSNYAYPIKNGQSYNEKKAKAEDVGVKAVDDKTLEINLEYPVPYFLDILAWHLLTPLKQDVVQKNPNSWANDAATLVSDGPFKLVEWKHNNYMLLEKNPNYWDAKNVKLEKVKLTMITDENTALTSFKTGQSDFINLIPAAQVSSLISSGEAKATTELGTKFLIVNTTKKPLDDARVRKALSLVIDRDSLVTTVLKSGEKAADAYISSATPDIDGKDFRSNGSKFIDTKANIDEAKKLLAEAGFPDGKGFPEISFLFKSSSPVMQSYAEALQSMWKKNLGINVTLKNQESKVLLAAARQGNFDIVNFGWSSDFYDAGSLFDLWVTNSPNNYARYSSQKYDQLITQAEKEMDAKKRSELFHSAEEVLMNDTPIIPVYYLNQNYMIKPNIKGMNVSPLAYLFFRNVTIE